MIKQYETRLTFRDDYKKWDSVFMSFKENLPPLCPPEGSVPPNENEPAYRLLEVHQTSDEDFKSHQELKPHVVYSDPCRYRSVSLVRTYVQCQDAIKLKRMKKFKFAAQLILQPDSGMVERDSDHHMNWWMSKSCDHKKITVEIVEL